MVSCPQAKHTISHADHQKGLSASITVKNGDIFTGIFHGATMEGPESGYLLKMVQQVNHRGEVNGVKEVSEEYIGVGNEHAMSFDLKDVIHLAAAEVGFNARDKSQNGICLDGLSHHPSLITFSRL